MNTIPRLLFACGLLLCFIACNSDGPAYTIEPPFKSITPKYDTFELDASEPKTLRLSSGSSIEIPENAFVDKQGNVVKGKVALTYREFHTAADILASGIPMMCNDENGEAKPFESGGMFEITATANGEEINIAKDKKINVNLASKVEGDFDFYYLEEDGNKKVETASLFLQTQSTAATDKQYRWKKLYTASEDTVKNPPAREKNPNAKYFQAHFDTKKYTAAAAIDTIKWEYAGLNKSDDPTDPSNAYVKNTTWSSVRISQPVYYTEQIKQVQLHKFNNNFYWAELEVLPDNLGFVAGDGADYLSYYGWDGKLKARFKGATRLLYTNRGTKHAEYLSVNKLHTHILLTDNKYNCKLYALNGTLIKDFGFLNNPSFDKSGNKVIGERIPEDYGIRPVSIYSLTGNTLHNFSFDVTSEGVFYSHWETSPDQSNIAVIASKKLTVFDVDGKEQASMDARDIQDWHFANYNQSIVIYTKNNEALIWDWNKNETFKAKLKVEKYTFTISPQDPILILKKDNSEFFWNWEKDTYKEIKVPENQHTYFSFSKKGNFIYPQIFRDTTDVSRTLLSTEGNIILSLKKSKWCFFEFSENEDRIIVQDDSTQLFLIDKSGKKIVDFKLYDSEIVRANFCSNESILTQTVDGTVMLWGQNGKLLNTVRTNKEMTAFCPGKENFFYGYSNQRPTECWDFKTGALVYAYNQEFVMDYKLSYLGSEVIEIPDDVVLSRGNPGKSPVILWKKTSVKLPSGVHRISFKKDTIEFHTYAYVDQKQIELLTKYQNQYDLIRKRENEEKQRVIKEKQKNEAQRVEEEEKLVRSFAINNFGIYNWDRFYKDINALFVNATMELDTSIMEFNNITFFLITGKDRNVVIKYYSSVVDKFRFVPEDNNMMLAVLPNERIAIFEEEKFRKLDIAEIKKKGTYTFKLKIISGETSKAVLDRILQKPS
ncbi:WD40 repeat domain-containing protein [Cytophaga aurantiaca]|uniref:WD40 repeat domain-containing protein n=1 Tax=Cytophaga aurantiaca TaxID=29530 RepID=UPI000362FB5A|nr:WD40 repeat domain-containing protein [Cytophaga aurantiaca]